jgi:hypothetical protein
VGFPQRRGERKMVTVGSVWFSDTAGEVTVMAVQSYDAYTYVTYRRDGHKINEDPIDLTAFVLRFTAKSVKRHETKERAAEIQADPDSGKIRMVGWAG